MNTHPGAITDAQRDALHELWGEAGLWTANRFEGLNRYCFAGEVPYSGIVWGLTPHGGHLGHCSPTGRITLHPALLDPQANNPWGISGQRLGERYAADVLLHEMIHALFRARGIHAGGKKGEHNSPHWCAEIMRLSALIGLGEIKAQPLSPRKVNGKSVRLGPKPGYLTQAELATWPHCLRAPEYYLVGNRKIHVPI